MEVLQETPVLEFTPNTLCDVRKQFDLCDSRRMEEAIDLLENWIRKQRHFMKTDFPRDYLERCIIFCKGSVEKAKRSMDSTCTLRYLMPHLYKDYDFRSEQFNKMFEVINTVILPKFAPDYHRVFLLKCSIQQADKNMFTNFFGFSLSLLGYWRAHDYSNGFIGVLDYRDMSVTDFIASLDLMDLRLATNMYIEGYKGRVKGVHVLTSSSMISAVITILKQGVSRKIRDRFHVHNSLEELHEVVPKDILPLEYGGEERSIKELQDDWVKVLSSEGHKKHLREMKEAVINEANRPKDFCGDEYAGITGSFRTLNVD